MQGYNLTCTSAEESSLLFKLRFACLISRHVNLMLDSKVRNQAVNLLKFLQHCGPSPKFRAYYIDRTEQPTVLGHDFQLIVASDLKSIDIIRSHAPATADG